MSGGGAISDADRMNFENQIKALEKQLLKTQEGKIDNTDAILKLSSENKQLTGENQALSKKVRDLQDRLQEVEQTLSQKIIDDADKDDMISIQ